ncbi:MAG: ABC transporter substrate-binding protein [Vicinamibacterales bacterium]
MLTRREALLGAAGIVGGTVFGACGGSGGRDRVTVANTTGGLNMTMAELMRQKRFLEVSGVDFEVLDVADGSKILGGIVGGSIHASMMSGIAQVFPAIERGADLKIIGGSILVPALGLYTSQDEVRSLRDLEGRVVGSGSVGALTHMMTMALLKEAGVDVAKVQFANIGSSADVFRAVVGGKIAAGVGPASIALESARQGVRLLDGGNMAERLSNFTYSAAWASGRAIAERRDALVQALAAYARLYRFVQAADAQDAFVRARAAVYPNVAAAEHLAEFNFVQQYKPFATSLVLEPGRLEYLQKLNADFGNQQRVLPFAEVADMSLAEAALRLLDS